MVWRKTRRRRGTSRVRGTLKGDTRSVRRRSPPAKPVRPHSSLSSCSFLHMHRQLRLCTGASPRESEGLHWGARVVDRRHIARRCWSPGLRSTTAGATPEQQQMGHWIMDRGQRAEPRQATLKFLISPISQAPALFVCLLRFAFRPRLLLLGYTTGRGRGGAMNALASAIGVPGRRSSAVDRTGCELRSLPFRYERWCIGAQWTRCPAAHCTAVPLLLLLLSLHASVGTA